MDIVYGQENGFHFIFVTNYEIEWFSLISIGNAFQLTEPKYLKEFLPSRTEFTEGITSSVLYLKLMVLSLFTRNSFKLFPEIPWRALQFSIKSLWTFWWWIQKGFSKASNWSNVDTSSSYTILKALSCNLLIFVVGTSVIKHPNNRTIFKQRLHKSFKKCPSFNERKQFRHSRKSTCFLVKLNVGSYYRNIVFNKRRFSK